MLKKAVKSKLGSFQKFSKIKNVGNQWHFVWAWSFSQTRSSCPLGCIIEAPLRPLHKAFLDIHEYPYMA